MQVVASKLILPIGLPTVPEVSPLSNNRSPDSRFRPSIGGVAALQYIPYHIHDSPEDACVNTNSFDTIGQLL